MHHPVAVVVEGTPTEVELAIAEALKGRGLDARVSADIEGRGVEIIVLSARSSRQWLSSASAAVPPGPIVALLEPSSPDTTIQTRAPIVDLRGWTGDPSDERLEQLVDAVNATYASAPHLLPLDQTAPTDASSDPGSTPADPGAPSTSTRPTEQVDWSPDDPAVIDALQRKPIARFLAAQLERLTEDQTTRRSFLVHIDGPWGSGKSTLLRFLADEVEPKRWVIVRFDAWRQSKAGPAWLLLLQALRAAVIEATPRSGRLRLRWRERGRLLRRAVSGAAVATFLGVVALTALALLVLHWTLSLKNADDLLKVATGVLALVGVVWTAANSFTSVVAFDSRHAGRAFEMGHTDPMEALARHFTWLLSQSATPVLFLIDDLDRCEQAYVVDLLDTVQKLVRDAPSRPRDEADRESAFFIVAADGRWLRSAYEVAHPGFVASVGDAGRPLGALFLEKLFQLTVSVPVLGPAHQRAFLASLLGSRSTESSVLPDATLADRLRNVHGSDVVDVLRTAAPLDRIRAADVAIGQLLSQESAQQTEHALMPFWRLLDPNPRSMKRFVMAYSIARAVSVAEGNVIELEPLALWTIMTLRWPLLAEHLQAEPEDVAYFRAARDALPPWIPGSLSSLFTEPPHDLRAVMNHPNGGPLTAEVIHRCCGTIPDDEVAGPAET
jgi:hypothetical protein